MKKGLVSSIVVLICVFIMGIYANADTGNERTWCFQDTLFSDIANGTITTAITKNGLTLGNGIEIDIFTSPVKTLYFERAIYTMANGSRNSGYLKFSVNGATDIHILGRSKSNEVDRNLTIYSTADSATATVKMTPKTDDYVYKYRGGAGDVYLYTAGDGVKIYSISAKNYNVNEYAALSEGTKKVWDFVNYKDYIGIINENKNLDNLQIRATESNSMKIWSKSGYSKNTLGYSSPTYLDLSGRIRYEGRYITFPVNRNSDIYITASSSDGISDRKLFVWNKYYGTPKMSLSGDYITVNGEIETYKISYYGDGEDFMLGSEDSGIDIFKISVVPRVNKIINYKKWDISNNSSFSTGSYTNSTIDGLNIINATVENNAATGNQKAVHIKSRPYRDSAGGMLKFDVSDSSNPRGAAIKRTITIKAKSAYDEEMKLVLISSDDYIIGATNLTTDIKEYKFDYTGSYDSIYVYSYYPSNAKSAGAYIYSIDNGFTGNVGPEDIKKTISVVDGQTYRYFITCDNIEDMSRVRFTIIYNYNAVRPIKIGENATIKSSVWGSILYYDSNITNISEEDGILSFDVNKTDKDWSGILCPVEFRAYSTGNTTIQIQTEVKS